MQGRMLALIPVALLAQTGAAAPVTPFPAGYEAAYRAYVSSLPVAARNIGWLTKFEGVSSPPRSLKLSGKPVQYLFACRNHYCHTDNVNIFLFPDRRSFRSVLKLNGKQVLLGGAEPAETACVRRLDATGGVAEDC